MRVSDEEAPSTWRSSSTVLGRWSIADIRAVKDAAYELLKVYNPVDQPVALLALPYAQPAPNQCRVASPQNYPNSTDWDIVGLSNNYKNPDGTLNTSSALVSTIECLDRAANPSIFVSGNNRTSAGHTNLGDPMAAAASFLAATGRPAVPDIVVFMTDGQANQPDGLQPCSYAVNKAATAKATQDANGIHTEVYTIGYGLGTVTVQPGYLREPLPERLRHDRARDMATSSADNTAGRLRSGERERGRRPLLLHGGQQRRRRRST